MDEALQFDGKTYISSKRAAEISGYTKDYIGQLCRAGKLDARLVGRNWYIAEGAIEKTQKRRNYVVPAKQKDQEEKQIESTSATEQQGSASEAEQEVEESEKGLSIDTKISDEVFGVNVHSDELHSSVPIQAPEHAISRRDELVPSQRQPSQISEVRFDRQRKQMQDALLADLHVVFDEGMPVYYNDDRPLIPEPSKVKAGAAGSSAQGGTRVVRAPSRHFASKFNGVYVPPSRRVMAEEQKAFTEHIPPQPSEVQPSQRVVKSPISDVFQHREAAALDDSSSLKVAASILFFAVAVAGAIAVFSVSRTMEYQNLASPQEVFSSWTD